MRAKDTEEKKRGNSSGFTLIEVVLITTLVIIMTSVLLVISWGQRADKELEVAARVVAGAIREAQNYALNGRQVASDEVPCEFGFQSVAPRTYKIVYNYHSGDGNCTSSPKDVAVYTVKNNVTIPDIGPIYFDIPHGDLTPIATTTITVSKSGKSRNVCVYASGRVEEAGTLACN